MAHAPSSKRPVEKIASHYVRWRFDPNAVDGRVEPQELVAIDGEMPKVDDRHATKPYKSLFLSVADPSKENAPVGGSYNAIARCDVDTGKYVYWSAGEDTTLHEVAFVPRTPDGKYKP
jgi:carotenoid cleavage dioxygenase-like enzyme